MENELAEISGLETFNDTTLVAINDSGNSSTIYFVNFDGKILKRTIVRNALNNDWEDLATDDLGNLYISDLGNNMQNRKNLSILKIDLKMAFVQDSIDAEKIWIAYNHQKDFKPSKQNVYDSEALYWYRDSLRILNKIRSKPRRNKITNGSFEYKVTSNPGKYNLYPGYHFDIAESNRLKFQVTSCDQWENTTYLLTYGGIYFFNSETRTKIKDPIKFRVIKQYESIVVLDKMTFFVATEKRRFERAPYLYKYTAK